MQPLPRQRFNDVKRNAEHLMRALGRAVLGLPLQDLGWSFGFDRARRRLGCCTWKRGGQEIKRITVSRYFVMHHGLDHKDETGLQVVDDVIRHEIAHAIDFEQRGRSGHDSRWKAICRKIGADPTRLYEGKGIAPIPGKYVATCPRCSAQTQLYRRPTRRRACGPCCKRFNGGRYTRQFELLVRERETGALVRIGRRSPRR